MHWQDERGWYAHEKARMALGYWAFDALSKLSNAIIKITGGRASLFWVHLPGGKAPNNRIYHFWLWLASLGYLYKDWRRGDMPENVRIGGVWR